MDCSALAGSRAAFKAAGPKVDITEASLGGADQRS
jgi:hypothetical protein